MFSNKTNSPLSPLEGCKYSNDYLVAIFESFEYHGVGRTDETPKISRLAIFEQHYRFPGLKINRILENDADDFLEALHRHENIKGIDGGLSPNMTVNISIHDLGIPGLLVNTLSNDASKNM